MKKTMIVSTLALLTGWVLSSPVRAASSPQQVIQEGAEKVRKILKKKVKKGSPAEKQQKEKLKKVVDEFLDYKELSRLSLGPHWKDRAGPEKTEFTALLRDLIEASYTSTISKNVEFTMAYEDEEIDEDGTRATVISVASAKNKKGKLVSEDLTFHLYLNKRQWMIYDVEFGDVSLVRHYRGEFNRKIKKESYAALLTAMRKKLEEIESGKIKAEKQPKL